MSDPKVIYLAPACEAESGEGRTWAEDNPWPDCDCGHRPVMYVIGDTFSRMKAERDALQQRLNAADEDLDRAGGAYLNKNAECLKLRERADVLEGLLRVARQFVTNGVELGYITMPDPDTPDTAHDLVPMIDAALKPTEGGGDA